MAWVSSAMSVGLILGPVLGGVIYQTRGYYSAFGLAFAFIGVDLVLRIILVEKKIAVRYAAIPPPHVEETSPVKLQELASPTGINTEEEHLPEPAVAPASIAPHTSKIPTVIRILKYPRLLTALFLSFVQALILSAFDATLPLYLNRLFGYSALQSGIEM
jgi:MFS family permease